MKQTLSRTNSCLIFATSLRCERSCSEALSLRHMENSEPSETSKTVPSFPRFPRFPSFPYVRWKTRNRKTRKLRKNIYLKISFYFYLQKYDCDLRAILNNTMTHCEQWHNWGGGGGGRGGGAGGGKGGGYKIFASPLKRNIHRNKNPL